MKTGKWTEVVEGDGRRRTFVVRNKMETPNVQVALMHDVLVTTFSDVTTQQRWPGDFVAGADCRNVDVELKEPLPEGKTLYVVVYGPGCAP